MRIVLVTLLIVISCTQPKSKEANRIDKSISVLKEISGVIDFNLLNIVDNNLHFKIYNPDGSTYMEIAGSDIKFGNIQYNLKEDNEELLRNRIGARWFFPEYDIMVTDCVAETDINFNILIRGSIKYIKKDDKIFKYYSYRDFIANKTFQLNKNSPLREFPNETSNILIGYGKYTSFQIIEFKEEWIKVKPDVDLYGNINFSGWYHWEINNKLQINNINFSF